MNINGKNTLACLCAIEQVCHFLVTLMVAVIADDYHWYAERSGGGVVGQR